MTTTNSTAGLILRCTNGCLTYPAAVSDGMCSDGGPGAEYAQCLLGDDCNDCGPRYVPAPPPPPPQIITCTNTCSYYPAASSDGTCSDGGPGSVVFAQCRLGEDCLD